MYKRFSSFVFLLLITSSLLVGCISASAAAPATPVVCPNPGDTVKAFYDANDAGKIETSLSYLTDDVVYVGWAEGANGHHMSSRFTVGKDQIGEVLVQPGLRRLKTGNDLPNYSISEMRSEGNEVTFRLTPDRTHPNGRPYNAYQVEIFFRGCQIEIVKVVERVSWL